MENIISFRKSLFLGVLVVTKKEVSLNGGKFYPMKEIFWHRSPVYLIDVLARGVAGSKRRRQSLDLHCYVIQDGPSQELKAQEKKQLLSGLFRASIRRNAEPAATLVNALAVAEADLIDELRRPTDEERSMQIRHAIPPLFAGVITV